MLSLQVTYTVTGSVPSDIGVQLQQIVNTALQQNSTVVAIGQIMGSQVVVLSSGLYICNVVIQVLHMINSRQCNRRRRW